MEMDGVHDESKEFVGTPPHQGRRKMKTMLSMCMCMSRRSVGFKDTSTESEESAKEVECLEEELHQNDTPKGGKESFFSVHSSILPDEVFQSASSMEDITTDSLRCNDEKSTQMKMAQLNEDAPRPTPTDSLFASLQTVWPVPEATGLGGLWRKAIERCEPYPSETDLIVPASYLVHQVRKKIRKFNIDETPEEIKFTVIMPTVVLPSFVEAFNKDGSMRQLRKRRDDCRGLAIGQAMALEDGRLLTRVWNLGALPEVMYQELYELEEDMFRVEQSVFILNSTKRADQTVIMVRRFE